MSISKVIVGEIGGKNDEVQESILSLSTSLTTDLTSEIKFTIFDPGFKMVNAGYFLIRRPVAYAGLNFEISSVEVDRKPKTPDTVKLFARGAAVQKMKRDKGSTNFGKISPSTFAQQKATEFGIGIFAEGSAAKAAITRTHDENSDESTWDVMNRLAGDNEFITFETDGILYFASEKFIIENQTGIAFNPFTQSEGDAWYVHEFRAHRSDDEPMGFDIDFSVNRTNGKQLRPGMVVRFNGLKTYDKPAMITSVEWDEVGFDDGLGDAKPDPVRVNARTPEDNEDVGAETKSQKTGSRGDDVLRLQQALASAGYSPGPLDGIFGPKTRAAVERFQADKELPVTGIADPATWDALGVVTGATLAATQSSTTLNAAQREAARASWDE